MTGTSPEKTVKCLVWDLDNTIWQGTLAEGDNLVVKPGVVACLEALDGRGILHSIASRNDHQEAWSQLRQFGLSDYFVEPNITWGPKSLSIKNIANRLNIGLDTLALVDDDPFERAEVSASLPQVRCYPAEKVETLAELEEFTPIVLTHDGRRRRQMYHEARARDEHEITFVGSPNEFLETLGLALSIRLASVDDIDRVEELTIRTNQLNSTGLTFSRSQLGMLTHSDEHVLLIIELADKFGEYGRVGLALLQRKSSGLELQLLLFSCRVLSRGASGAFLGWLIAECQRRHVPLTSLFSKTDRNRPMLIALRFAGFEVRESSTDPVVLAVASDANQRLLPSYLSYLVEDDVYRKLDVITASSQGS